MRFLLLLFPRALESSDNLNILKVVYFSFNISNLFTPYPGISVLNNPYIPSSDLSRFSCIPYFFPKYLSLRSWRDARARKLRRSRFATKSKAATPATQAINISVDWVWEEKNKKNSPTNQCSLYSIMLS